MSEMTSERTEVFRQLSVDVDYLASALGEVVRELEGERLFALVERVRSMTKSSAPSRIRRSRPTSRR